MLILSLALSFQSCMGVEPPDLEGNRSPETRLKHFADPALSFTPLDAFGTGTFESSDPLLESRWGQAKAAIARRQAAGFRAEIFAARGPFWGDASLLSKSYLWLTGDGALSRMELDTVLHPRPLAIDAVPRTGHRPLAEYSLLWPATLRDYYRHTGDSAYTRALAGAVLDELFVYFEGFRAPSGLLSGVGLDGAMEPWPEGLRKGFDYDNAAGAENSVLNAFYYHALKTAVELADKVGLPSLIYHQKAEAVRGAFKDRLLDLDTGLFFDAPESGAHSLAGNALALCFGLVEKKNIPRVIDLIRAKGMDCAADFAPYVIEATFKAGEPRLGYDLITFLDEAEAHVAPISLIIEYVAGLAPSSAGWGRAAFAPRFPKDLESARLSIPIQGGRATVRYARNLSTALTLPPGVGVEAESSEGESIMLKSSLSHADGTLTETQWALLESKGWHGQVGGNAAVWVSVAEQMLWYIRGKDVLFHARCASSESGVGSKMNSLQTPLGWHSIARKVGESAPWGQVFRSRQATREVWQPGEDTTEDLVLSRILLLTGEEPGKNRGGDVDSFARNIYIHGTNDEARIGTPSSHGCIRLTNDDVIEAFRHISEDTLVLITEF